MTFIFNSMVGMIFSNLTNIFIFFKMVKTTNQVIPFDFHIFQRGRYTTNQKVRRRIQQPARIRAKFKKTQEIRISVECVMRCFGSILWFIFVYFLFFYVFRDVRFLELLDVA